jgi:hypothetical protein
MTTAHSPFNSEQEARFEKILARYVVAAAGTGAIPVPLSSAAIVVENAAMIAHFSTVARRPLELKQVLEVLGLTGTLNVFGKTIFLEGAKTLLAFTGAGTPFLVGLCALGAATAGLQTYLLGLTCLAILRSGRDFLTAAEIKRLAVLAKETYEQFLKNARSRAVLAKA